MESQHLAETKDEHIVYVADRRLLGLLPMFILVLIIVLRISWTLYKSFGQKTRNPQQRRMYVGSRARPSLGQAEPTIYVSPCNLPPPPKYECMAPPSYEEVVGVHYPNFQPINQPITTALAQSTDAQSSTNNDSVSRSNDTVARTDDTVARTDDTVTRSNDETIVTVTAARTVATSS